jgi:hypothetical protein
MFKNSYVKLVKHLQKIIILLRKIIFEFLWVLGICFDI